MRDVACHQRSTVFERRGGDDQIGVVARNALAVRESPKIGCPVEDRIGDGQYQAMATEYLVLHPIPGNEGMS